MANTRQKLETRGVIMTLLSLVLMNMGCEDKIDSPVVNPSEGKTVEVALNIGLANETDGYDLSASTKTLSGKEGAFNVELTPTTTTRASTAKPDQLYKLEIRQYDQNGKHLNGNGPTNQIIGQTLTVNLTEAKDCQLVFVAWGQNSQKSLGGIDLPQAQEIAIDASVIKSITDETINEMPYILHLKHVNVTGNKENGVISSPNGEDVRILLKRLATRLTLNWTYSYEGYSLKQILLESIPLNYKVIPKPDKDENNTYPSLLDQYTTIQLSEEEIENGSYTCWIPANVRGTNNESNSPLYRIKANAPLGSSYASFIAGNKGDVKKKLNYRVYLGGSDYTEFNLYGNTDYSYTVNFKHTELPVNDHRVTIIDPIPASENNENLVPTANCFMVAPGGAFCFDPFKYQINGNDDNVNTTLQGWATSGRGGIASVKLIWQTKENGDIGEPVMGVVNSSDDHMNIVDIKRRDKTDISSNLVTGINQAYIYCRVAPNTAGGNGLIAALDKNGDILWSWHIWVSDYNPDPTGDQTVLKPENKRKQKYEGNNADAQYPMMDRNIGAQKGFIELPTKQIEMSKANGLQYQRGRKDPFLTSYSQEPIESVSIVDEINPPKGLQNMYAPDGITYISRKGEKNAASSYENAYKTPYTLYASDFYWNSAQQKATWNSSTKDVHDPCPAGWRVPVAKNYQALFNGTWYSGQATVLIPRGVSSGDKNSYLKEGANNGYLISYDNNGNKSYFRLTGYGPDATRFTYIGTQGTLQVCEYGDAFVFGSKSVANNGIIFNVTKSNTSNYWVGRDSHSIRCIQERE